MGQKLLIFIFIASPKKQIQPQLLYIQKQIVQQSVRNPYPETDNAETLKTQTRCMRQVLFKSDSLSDLTYVSVLMSLPNYCLPVTAVLLIARNKSHLVNISIVI